MRVARFARLAGAIIAVLMITATAMAAGDWCFLCHDVKDDVCRDGACLAESFEPDVDFEALHHEPIADWGGAE